VTMKSLIAISSCRLFEHNGFNQVCRDTFLKDVSGLEGLDYRIFVGSPNASKTELPVPLSQYFLPHKQGEFVGEVPPADDVVELPVPDSYPYVAYKTKEKVKWAIENGYDYVFVCYSDPYFDALRLAFSGYQDHEYTGKSYSWLPPWSPVTTTGARGGAGYWVGPKAAKLIAESEVTDWADDRWVSTLMASNGIILHSDSRYAEYPTHPAPYNDIISSHLFTTPAVYDTAIVKNIYSENER